MFSDEAIAHAETRATQLLHGAGCTEQAWQHDPEAVVTRLLRRKSGTPERRLGCALLHEQVSGRYPRDLIAFVARTLLEQQG